MEQSVPETRNFGDMLLQFHEAYAPMIWLCLIGYLLIINFATYLLFKLDKARAIGGLWRVSEGTLLSCSFFGGSIGAKIAQRRYRHKNCKEPFRSTLNSICVLQVVCIVAFCIWALGFAPAISGWFA